MIDPLIKMLKKRDGDGAEVLNYMDDLKASTNKVETAEVEEEEEPDLDDIQIF